MAGAHKDCAASATALLEPSEGPPTVMALALGSGGVDKGPDTNPAVGPGAVAGGTDAEAHVPEGAVVADRSLKKADIKLSKLKQNNNATKS